MTIDVFTNPHAQNYTYCRVTYWQGNTACGVDDAWDRCRLEGMGRFPTIEFRREQEAERDRLLRLLAQAYEAGRATKAREIREALGL